MSLFDLTGRWVVVTGARGFLGRPICAALAEAGATVVAVDRYPDAHRVGLPRDEPGIWPADYDVLDVDGLRILLAALTACGSSPCALLTLAGIDPKPEGNGADPSRDWDRFLEVNVTGTKNSCEVFGTAMAKAGRGSIVLAGSLYAHLSPAPGLYDSGFTKATGYTVSKHAVLGLTRHLAAMWASAGVRVNCLSPGGIGSDSTPADFRERFSDRVPLGRMGTPGDLVGAIIWLLSDGSKYVTGQEIRVDGGVGIIP